MEESRFLQALRPYHEAFATDDPARRLELLAAAMTPTAEIWGPQRVFAGHADIATKIEGFRRRWPGCRLALASGLNRFGNVARFGCAIVTASGDVVTRGEAVVELADDGRIDRVLPFWEPLPALPTDWPRTFAAQPATPTTMAAPSSESEPAVRGR